MKNIYSTTFLCLYSILILSISSLQAQSDNILSIDGMDFGAGIVVMWETLDAPKHGQSFIIERAFTANSGFEKIGEVNAGSDLKMRQFAFEDRDLGLSQVFYRIKTVEKDEGIESYSMVVPVQKEVSNNFLIQETEQFDKHKYRVSVISVIDGDMKYQLTTNMGEVVLEKTVKMKMGENDFLVDLESETDGAYVVSFQNESYTVTKNFNKKSEKNDNVARKD